MSDIAQIVKLTPEEIRSIFLWGAIGGMLPTLGKIAGTFGANFDAPPPRLLGVAIALALYAVIGSIVSRAIANPDMKQSLFAGIAAPAIVVSVLAGASDSKTIPTASTLPAAKQFNFLVTRAYAERRVLLPDQPAKEVNLVIETAGGVPISGQFEVFANTPNESRPILRFSSEVVGTFDTVVFVPADTTALRIVLSNGREKTVRLTAPVIDNSNIRMTLFPRTSSQNDLLWALGGKREFGIGDFTATIDSKK